LAENAGLPGAKKGKSRPLPNQHRFEKRMLVFYRTAQVGCRLSGQELLGDLTLFPRGFAAFSGRRPRLAPLMGVLGCTVRAATPMFNAFAGEP